jgi:hypothetical protein
MYIVGEPLENFILKDIHKICRLELNMKAKIALIIAKTSLFIAM